VTDEGSGDGPGAVGVGAGGEGDGAGGEGGGGEGVLSPMHTFVSVSAHMVCRIQS